MRLVESTKRREQPKKRLVYKAKSARFLAAKATVNGKYVSRLGLERAARYNAVPKWVKGRIYREIEKLYIAAQLKNLKTGRKHQIDHEIPLWHPKVCGLHVPWNLRIMGKRANELKSNHFTPLFYTRGKRVKSL